MISVTPTDSLFTEVTGRYPGVVENADPHGHGPGQFSFAWTGNGDGTPLAGLAWQTNYDGGEEFGSRDLRVALTGVSDRNYTQTADARRHIAAIEDIPGAPEACALVLSTRPVFDPPETGVARIAWGAALRRHETQTPTYPSQYRQEVPWAQGLPSDLRYNSMTQLRDRARALGIAPMPRRKADLVAAITTHPDFAALATHPLVWPAVFVSREALVLRADRGPAAAALSQLVAAADAGALGVGDGSGPFATGMFFYDTRDEHPSLIRQREAAHDYYEARMPIAERLSAELTADGYHVYALGNPSWVNPMGRYDEPREVFWLNAYLGPHAVFGWFTAEELESRALAPDRPAHPTAQTGTLVTA